MDIYLTTPPCAVLPWALKSYTLNTEKISFSLSSEINFHPILDKETLLFDQMVHSVTHITVRGVISDDSDIPGADIYEKRDNLIAAGIKWNIATDIKVKTNCPQLIYHGNTFYAALDRVETERVAGANEIPYILNFIENEGS